MKIKRTSNALFFRELLLLQETLPARRLLTYLTQRCRTSMTSAFSGMSRCIPDFAFSAWMVGFFANLLMSAQFLVSNSPVSCRY